MRKGQEQVIVINNKFDRASTDSTIDGVYLYISKKILREEI